MDSNYLEQKCVYFRNLFNSRVIESGLCSSNLIFLPFNRFFVIESVRYNGDIKLITLSLLLTKYTERLRRRGLYHV